MICSSLLIGWLGLSRLLKTVATLFILVQLVLGALHQVALWERVLRSCRPSHCSHSLCLSMVLKAQHSASVERSREPHGTYSPPWQALFSLLCFLSILIFAVMLSLSLAEIYWLKYCFSLFVLTWCDKEGRFQTKKRGVRPAIEGGMSRKLHHLEV